MADSPVKIICFYGPESTGKSTMAKHLATEYKTEFVPEVAKELITTNQFTIEDIIKIGQVQTQRIKEKLKTANKFLFCDTDLITTQIYSQKYLGVVPSVLYELEKEIQFYYYFLFDIDVPWVADGLRDLKNERETMMQIFKNELANRRITPTLVKGNWMERESTVTNTLNQLQ